MTLKHVARGVRGLLETRAEGAGGEHHRAPYTHGLRFSHTRSLAMDGCSFNTCHCMLMAFHGQCPIVQSAMYTRPRCLRVQVWMATPLCTKLSFWGKSSTVYASSDMHRLRLMNGFIIGADRWLCVVWVVQWWRRWEQNVY